MSIPNPSREERTGNPLLFRMALLYFLIMCSLGILKPLKNAFALVGLGTTQFYRVYFVGAVVVLFVPLYNRFAERVPVQRLIPGIALVFGLNLLLFRVLYREGSTAYGLVFYGWYDLFAAVVVTQVFLAAQYVFNTREARGAYPVMIGGGAIGATLGGAITGFGAPLVGPANLLLVAALFLVAFGAALPRAWESSGVGTAAAGRARPGESLRAGELRTLLAERHVRLIAVTVLLSVLVKQLVDYQFNTLTGEVFVTHDAISAFQGKFNAATQWLPLLVLLVLRPAVQRWGVGLLLFLLPGVLLLANLGLAVSWVLGMAVAAKAADASLRHTAERAGREILYLPVPENIKLKAKLYIDVAIEEGLGKLLSALLIFALLGLVGYRNVGYAAAGLTLLWLLSAAAIQKEYVRALARSIEGRFASWKGHFSSIVDASTLPVLRGALSTGDPLQTAFTLELVDQLEPSAIHALAGELHRLLGHADPAIRQRALATLARYPAAIESERVRPSVRDEHPAVREAAIAALCLARPEEQAGLIEELLTSSEGAVRTAALAHLTHGTVPPETAHALGRDHLERCLKARQPGEVAVRIEIALTAATLDPSAETVALLLPLLDDPDPAVRTAAIRSAGVLRHRKFFPHLLAALRWPQTREAAREALLAQEGRVAGLLADHLLDEATDPVVRRQLPGVLAGLSSQTTVDELLGAVDSPEADRILGFRTLKALNKLRVRDPGLRFDAVRVHRVLEGEVAAAKRYRDAAPVVAAHRADAPVLALLARSVSEAWAERRERAFRCLGLVHAPDEMHRCFLALAGGNPGASANALEWLEHTVGIAAFARLAPVLHAPVAYSARMPSLAVVLAALGTDVDPWIAQCAVQARRELLAETAQLRVGEAAPMVPGVLDLGARRAAGGPALRVDLPDIQPWQRRADTMNLIEKVFLLQQIDLLHGARSAHLALLASIAEEVETEPGTVLLRQGEPTDALFVVIQGAVELRGVGEQVLVARNGTPFGTWALIDEAPSLVGARTLEPSRLLRITRHDFYDLLADHHELAQGLLQGLARRVRTLVSG